MIDWVVNRQTSRGRGAIQPIVSRHEYQRRQFVGEQLLIDHQSCSQVHSVVCAQRILLNQVLSAIHDIADGSYHFILMQAVRTKRVQCSLILESIQAAFSASSHQGACDLDTDQVNDNDGRWRY